MAKATEATEPQTEPAVDYDKKIEECRQKIAKVLTDESSRLAEAESMARDQKAAVRSEAKKAISDLKKQVATLERQRRDKK